MEKKDATLHCEIDCSIYILSKLNKKNAEKLSAPIILHFLHYKTHYNEFRERILSIFDPMRELENMSLENRWFYTCRELLDKLNIQVSDSVFYDVIKYEMEYGDQFDWEIEDDPDIVGSELENILSRKSLSKL
jgi:hypothetical protein